MARMFYESELDRRREQWIAERLCGDGPFTVRKMPWTDRIDFRVFAGGAVFAVLECKARDFRIGRYPDLIIDLPKWDAGLDFYSQGLGFYVAIGLRDGVFLFDYGKHSRASLDFVREVGGRTRQTRDRWDIGMIIRIPLPLFTRRSKRIVFEEVPE